MGFQKTLQGRITQLDPSSKVFVLGQGSKQAGKEESIPFGLSPNVSVTNRGGAVLKVSTLKIGLSVVVRYVTRPTDKKIAEIITVLAE